MADLVRRPTRRTLGKLLASLGAALAARPVAAADAPYEVALISDIMVPMRDGVRLATDVYRPARNGRPVPGRFPVILERTPYGKTVVSRSERTASNPMPLSRAEVAAFFVSPRLCGDLPGLPRPLRLAKASSSNT